MKKHFLSFSAPCMVILFLCCDLADAQNIAVNTSGTPAAATNMFEVTQTSAAANMVAMYAIHSGATAGTGYGLYATKTGASTTNIGGYFNASGGTNNYPGIFMGGNVGVGTVTPLARLHIDGTAETTPVEGYDITNTNVGNVIRAGTPTNRVFDGGVITFATGGSIGAYIKSGAVSGAQSRLYFGTYKGVNVMTPDLTIINNGNVGVGTTGPTAKFHVNAGDIGVSRIDGGDVTPYARFGLSNGWEQYLANNAFYNSTTSQWNYVNTGGYGGMASMMYQLSGVLSFYNANNAANPVVWNQRMTILNNGNVGINTPAPTAKLEVTGTAGSTIKIVDGNQGAGNVLTSDANGNGSWQPQSGGCMTQKSIEYTVAGAYTWTWPSTTTLVTIEMWGGGGGGAAGRLDCGQGNGWQNTAYGGRGGSAGAYISRTNVPVSGNMAVVVGAGGTGGTGLNVHNVSSNGTAGGNSSFGTIVAPGGAGGTVPGGGATAGTLTQGLFGFQCTGGWDGGAGAYMWSCGAGGSGGGTQSNGNGTGWGGGGGGGGSGAGGNGGQGRQGGATNGGAGGNATVYGAGGGGGGGYGDYSCCTGSCPTTRYSGNGGAGAGGYVKVTWWE